MTSKRPVIKVPVSLREGKVIIINIQFAGVILRIVSERALEITEEFVPFLASPTAEPDITVQVSWCLTEAEFLHLPPVGEDMLTTYYDDGQYMYCELNGGTRGPVAQTKYLPDFSYVKCAVRSDASIYPQDKIYQILRMLPLRQMLLYKKVLFLHASQVLYQDRGIVFTAPSGTGKTTQAKLWCDLRGADMICNDRTLIRRSDNHWLTYGYPFDGSEPVISDKVCRLGCIVVLRQGNENRITRLSPAKAITSLMEQTVINGWFADARQMALELIMEVFEDCPIYLFQCTADASAVSVLENLLRKEGVLNGTGI